MSFYGKEYVYDREENVDDFLSNLGFPDEAAEWLKNFQPTEKIEKDGDTYKLTMTLGDHSLENEFQSGVEFEQKFGEYATCHTLFTVEDNKITQVQTFEAGTTITTVREYSDDELVVKMKTSKWEDGEARRYHKAQ